MRLAEDRPSQEGGMNQNISNPGLTLRLPHPPSSAHWMEWRSCPECQPSTTGGTGHTSLAASKRRRWEKSPQAEAIYLIPEESAGQRLWEGLENQTVSKHQQEETRENTKGPYQSTSHTREFSTVECGSRGILT